MTYSNIRFNLYIYIYTHTHILNSGILYLLSESVKKFRNKTNIKCKGKISTPFKKQSRVLVY